VIATGRAEPHHILPGSGSVSFRLHGPEEVARAIELFRMQYDRYVVVNRR
jgi:hypothetical protein